METPSVKQIVRNKGPCFPCRCHYLACSLKLQRGETRQKCVTNKFTSGPQSQKDIPCPISFNGTLLGS